jgi:hypothetical protein
MEADDVVRIARQRADQVVQTARHDVDSERPLGAPPPTPAPSTSAPERTASWWASDPTRMRCSSTSAPRGGDTGTNL